MSDDEDELRTLGKRDIEEDPRFNTLFSRLELENRTESDNSSRTGDQSIKYKHPGDVVKKGEDVRLMQEMLDRKDTVKEMRKTYDNWIDGLESKGLLSLNQQVNDVVGSMSSPETASLQDIFKTMATKVGQHWDREADALFKNDMERAQALFLAAPSVSRRVNKLKVQANKIDMFDQLHLFKCQVDAQLIAFWDKQVADSEKKG